MAKELCRSKELSKWPELRRIFLITGKVQKIYEKNYVIQLLGQDIFIFISFGFNSGRSYIRVSCFKDGSND